MMDESEEASLWRDPDVGEPAWLLRFKQGLPDGVFEPRPGGQGPDDGQVSRRTPVRRTDVLGDDAGSSSRARDTGQSGRAPHVREGWLEHRELVGCGDGRELGIVDPQLLD